MIFSQTTQQGQNICGEGTPFDNVDVIETVPKFLPNNSIGNDTLQQLVHTDRQQCRHWSNVVVTFGVDSNDLVIKEDGSNFVTEGVFERTVDTLQFIQNVRVGATIVGGMVMAPMIRYKSDSLTIMSNANTPVLLYRDALVPLLVRPLHSSSGVVQNVNQRFG